MMPVADLFAIPGQPQNDVKKIGVFRALQLGDMLCIIPAIRALRTTYPQAHITLIGLPWAKNLTERFPHYFNDFIEFPGWPGLPEQEIIPGRVTKFLHKMQRQRFDLLLQMHGNGAFVNSMCMLCEAKKVAGLCTKDSFYSNNNLFPFCNEKDHEIIRFLKVIEALKIPLQGTELEFPLRGKEMKQVKKIKEELGLYSQKYVCLHPGARDPRRRWAAINFAFVGDKLAEKGYTIVLTGSEQEKELIKEVADWMTYPAIDPVGGYGNLSLGELAGLINDSAVLVSNDTGVSHIAAALKVPSVIVFSPCSDPKRWAPLNENLHTAILTGQATDPENVMNAAFKHLNIAVGEVAVF